MRKIVLCCTIAFFCGYPAASAQSALAVPDTASAARRRAVVPQQHCQAGVVAAQSEVVDVAVDASHVYYGDFSGNLHRVTKSNGGTPALLATLPGSWISFLALDDTHIYFQARNRSTDRDSVYVMPKEGGPPTLLIADLQYAWDMSAADGWLYLQIAVISATTGWPSDGRIIRIRNDGSAVETIASGLHGSMGMTVDDQYVYYTESGESPFDPSGGLRRVAKSGGAAESLATLPGAWSLAQDDTGLYVLRISQGERNASIDAVSKLDGRAATLVTGIWFEMFEPMEVFNGSLYFMNLLGTTTARIESVPVSGGERRTFAAYPWGFRLFAVDSCGVYVVTTTGVERAVN